MLSVLDHDRVVTIRGLGPTVGRVLNLLTIKPGPGPRVVLVHGFGQRAEVWDFIRDLVPENIEVVALDLPGHGETSTRYDRAGLVESARLVLQTGGPAIYVGYSFGARVLLAGAAEHQEVEALVLVGAKMPIAGSNAKSRIASDEKLAQHIEHDGVNVFVEEWLSQPFNARLPEAMQHRDLRTTNRAHGLAASLRNAGSGTPSVTEAALAKIACPVRLVRGSEDLPQVIEDQEKLLALLSNAESTVVEGSGHAVPFEHPETFAAILAEVLKAVWD